MDFVVPAIGVLVSGACGAGWIARGRHEERRAAGIDPLPPQARDSVTAAVAACRAVMTHSGTGREELDAALARVEEVAQALERSLGRDDPTFRAFQRMAAVVADVGCRAVLAEAELPAVRRPIPLRRIAPVAGAQVPFRPAA